MHNVCFLVLSAVVSLVDLSVHTLTTLPLNDMGFEYYGHMHNLYA